MIHYNTFKYILGQFDGVYRRSSYVRHFCQCYTLDAISYDLLASYYTKVTVHQKRIGSPVCTKPPSLLYIHTSKFTLLKRRHSPLHQYVQLQSNYFQSSAWWQVEGRRKFCHYYVFGASHRMWSLPMATNGNWVFYQNILFLLYSGRTGWKTNTFWKLSGWKVSYGRTPYMSYNITFCRHMTNGRQKT